MVFSSPVFLFAFLPATLAAYFLCPAAGRNLLLVAASLFFYAFGEGAYVALLVASIGFNYLAARAIDGAADRKRAWLAVGVGGNLLLLGFFKYWTFLFGSFGGLLGWQPSGAELPLPLGISFFTFQAISYLVDTYRGAARALRNPIDVALYISLFPQLVAGPIVRYEAVAAAIQKRRTTLLGATEGVELFIVGLSKKLLLANPLGAVADAAFASAETGLAIYGAWLGILCYALQIYFDFSGYTDMARGLGKLLGFEFPVNFRFPYLSLSVREFWRRWHISLSSWFRDYVYIPLGGSRRGRARTGLNLWIVFLLCGLWHGASWTFVLWGAAHGAWMALERTRLGAALEGGPRLLRWAATTLFLLFAWTLFRAESLSHGVAYLASLVAFDTWGAAKPVEMIGLLDTRFWIVFGSACFFALDGHGRLLRRSPIRTASRGVAPLLAVRFCGFAGLALLSFVQLSVQGYNPFIYFHF